MLLLAHGSGGGPVLITVPDLTGLPLAAAQTALFDLGLTTEFLHQTFEYDPVIAIGSVISQSPVAGSLANLGDTVSLVLSLGADPRNLGEVSRMRFTSFHSHMRFKVQ